MRFDRLPQVNSKYLLIGLFFALVVGYSLFQARFIILGPRISVEYPVDGQSVESNLVLVEGRARNVSRIELNGRQIFTDEEGYWKEKLLVSPGLSIMTLTARDRFGRETREIVRIVLNHNAQNES